MLIRKYIIAGFLAFVAFLYRPAVQGQTVVPSDDELKSKKKVYYIVLDRKSEETAESYIYILEQLDLLTSDYARYFSNCASGVSSDYVANLKQMTTDLSKGTYLKDIEVLKTDLDELTSKLGKRNKELKEYSIRGQEYRLGRHLQDELNTIQDLLQEEVELQYVQQTEGLQELEQYLEEREAETQERILKYHKTRVMDGVNGIWTNESKKITVVYDPETETYTSVITDRDVLNDSVVVETVLIGTTPEISSIDEANSNAAVAVHTPQPQHPSVAVVVETDRVQFSKSGDALYTRYLIDSSRYLSKTTPIFINNPTGNLTVVGWDRNYLLAEVEVVVSSATERNAQKFSDNIHLDMYLKRGRLYAEPVIPKLDDIHTRIISNKVVVKVPKGNKLVCKNSFGPVDIQNLNGGLKLIGEYSQIMLRDIEGEITAINTNGPIDVRDISGLLKLKNSSGRITVRNSSGTMELENLFAPTELSGSEGNIVIRSAGPVKVNGHHGDVTIINKEGKTEVYQIDGSLSVNNSFGPLLVQEVSGDASIENNSSRINVGNVSGRLTATNRYAPISVSNLIGPIDLNNDNGNISVYLNRDFEGSSSITSTAGTVNLHVLREPNLIVLASTTLGEIKSFFPLQVSQTGQESRATHTFGNGKNRLTVSGTGSTIVFSNAN